MVILVMSIFYFWMLLTNALICGNIRHKNLFSKRNLLFEDGYRETLHKECTADISG